ncbi:uncharacterized protein LOC117600491 [Osmia lignaria lignaria]|uniref:uncharacterized protein LOC117600491 n=1 Tax=Osmia lignaria lignaria TaxID=1437193 RepID=UPI0014792C32|nr:protamine-like [Osmia lignaria]
MEKTYGYENFNEDSKQMPQDTQQEVSPGMDVEVSEKCRPKFRGCGPRRRRRRKRSRKRKKCICKPKRRRKRRLVLSSNPFIIFYLEMWFKSHGKRVTEVAREAGKKWCALSECDKEKYIKIAERVKRRRSRHGRKC